MKLLIILALILGTVGLVCGPPGWLLKAEMLGMGVASLAFGFIAFQPRLPAVLRYKEVQGMALIYAGVICMFIDPRFILSGVFLGVGIRRVTEGGFLPVKKTGSAVVVRDKPGVVVR